MGIQINKFALSRSKILGGKGEKDTFKYWHFCHVLMENSSVLNDGGKGGVLWFNIYLSLSFTYFLIFCTHFFLFAFGYGNV